MKNKLIVIESLGDSFGKTTIANLLREKMNGVRYSFPSYLTPLGVFINEKLETREIDLLEVDPRFLANMYLYDFKSVHYMNISKDLYESDVILDRFYFSTLLYQQTIFELQSFKTKEQKEEFKNYLKGFIKDYLELPAPDYTFVLVDKFGVTLDMDKHGKTDAMESCKLLQETTRKNGLRLIEEMKQDPRENIITIEISKDNGTRKTPEECVQEMLTYIK